MSDRDKVTPCTFLRKKLELFQMSNIREEEDEKV